MNWEKLAELISKMSDEQKKTTVTFFDNRNEFFGIKSLEYTGAYNDVLDANHPFLTTL